MNRGHVAASVLAVLPLTGLTACMFSGNSGTGPSKVDDLVTWVERVHVSSEVARETVHSAAGALHAIAGQGFQGDAVGAFEEFLDVIEKAERQAKALRESIDPMKRAADPLFSTWNTDLAAFTNTSMRQRSQARLDETRSRYQAIVSAAEPAQAAFESFNLGLRDIALFLRNDFNSTSLSVVQDDVRSLTDMAVELDGRLDACLTAARAYVQSSALPVAAPAGAMPTAGDSN